MKKSVFQSPFKTVLLAGFIAGTLDILSAIIVLAKGNWRGTLKYVASGAFGPAAKEGGGLMMLYGACFHYIIAFSFTIAFFIAASHLFFLRKNPVLVGLIYGIVVWSFMSFIILPLTQIPYQPFLFSSAWKNILILMIAIGLPVSLITNHFYAYKEKKHEK